MLARDMINLYNTLTRQTEEFKPYDENHVKMYVCGPTLHDHIHIGNARSLVIYDIIYRVLKEHYTNVTYVRNITDIDDKIIDKSFIRSMPTHEYVKEYLEYFRNNCKELNILEPTHEPFATAYLIPMFTLMRDLLENGSAYQAHGHILMDSTKIKDFGALSGRKLEDMDHGSRVETAYYKRNPGDFVLWKPADGTARDPAYMSPWGYGRPGWHTECAAMSAELLGENFDIHGGGIDLVFPHHEAERSLCLAQHPDSTHAKYWIHNGALQVASSDDQVVKMSKSLGNVVTVTDLINRGWDGEVIRLSLLMANYSKPFTWKVELLEQSREVLDQLYNKIGMADSDNIPQENCPTILDILSDDFNLSRALAQLLVTHPSQLVHAGSLLGILQKDPLKWFLNRRNNSMLSDEEILNLVQQRNELRVRKLWTAADRIRDHLKMHHVILEDVNETQTRWKVV